MSYTYSFPHLDTSVPFFPLKTFFPSGRVRLPGDVPLGTNDIGEPNRLTAAYSTRQVRAGYSGPLMTIRRSSDDDEALVMFLPGIGLGVLDAYPVQTFVGAGDGRIVEWYSQVAPPFTLSIPNPAEQPYLMRQGQFIGGGPDAHSVRYPAAYFDGTNQLASIGVNCSPNYFTEDTGTVIALATPFADGGVWCHFGGNMGLAYRAARTMARLYTSRDNGTSFHVKDVSYSGGDVGQPHVLAGRWGTGSGTPYDLYSEHAASLGSDYAASSSLASTFRLGNVGQGTTGAGVADALYGTITEVLTYFDPLPVAVIQAIFQTITLPYNLP